MGVLRLILAISIIFVHAGKPFGYEIISAKVAIQSFFMISGFYMALIIHEKYDVGKNAYRIFITNRFLRIYPVYWTILLLSFLVAVMQCRDVLPMCLSVPTDSLFSISQYIIKNIFIFPSVGYFTPSAYYLGGFLIPYAWTLGVELLFYLIAPFIVKRRVVLLLLLGLLSFVIRILVFRYNAMEATDFLYLNMWFLPAELLFFIVGILGYKIYARIKNITIPLLLNRLILFFILVFTLLFGTLLILLPGKETAIGWIYYACVGASIPFIFNYTKGNRLNNILGEMSYAVYLSHFLVIRLLPSTSAKVSKDIHPLIIVVITVVFSYLLRRLLENPINAFRQRQVIQERKKSGKKKR